LLTTLWRALNRLPRGASRLRLTVSCGALCSVVLARGALANDLCAEVGDFAPLQLVDVVRQSLSALPQLRF
jgi:hypothetical protein